MNIEQITEYLAAGKTALDTLKGLVGLLPPREKHDALLNIADVEQALQLKHALMAKELGYK